MRHDIDYEDGGAPVDTTIVFRTGYSSETVTPVPAVQTYPERVEAELAELRAEIAELDDFVESLVRRLVALESLARQELARGIAKDDPELQQAVRNHQRALDVLAGAL